MGAAEERFGGAISPAWATNLRALVRPDGAPPNRRAITLVPEGMTVNIGDHVEYIGGNRDMSLPCNYIPTHIVADSGPATPANAAPRVPAANSDAGSDSPSAPQQ